MDGESGGGAWLDGESVMVNLGKMNASVLGSYLIFRKPSGYGFCENFGNQTPSGFGFCWVRITSKNLQFKFF